MGSELQQFFSASRKPSPEELDAYLHLRKEEIVRLVLCLLIEDGLREQVASLPASVGVHAAQHFGVRAAS